MKLKMMFRVLTTQIRFSIAASELFSFLLMTLALTLLPFSRTQAMGLLMRSHRNTRKLRRQLFIESIYKKFHLNSLEVVTRLFPKRIYVDRIYERRVFKLKEPRGKEKGVLLMKYSDTAAKVMLRYDLNKIMQDYYLVIEPSFSGYCTAEVLSLMELKGTKSLIQCPHKTDYDFIMRAGRSLVPVETGSNSWVDDRVFTDLSLPKEYDCIMVALWGDIKRHYLLFEAMEKINDPGYRVCLIGGPWGRLQKDIEELAEYYGVRDRIDFFEKLPPAKVNRLLNKSKVNALLSLKEGANKAIVEGFFANVPALAMEENLAIGTSYINEFTGRLTSREKLAETLLWFRDNYRSFQPRKWALDNIAPKISTAKIEETLKAIAAERGEPWTRSLVAKVNRPECEYYHPEEALSPLDLSLYSKQ